MTERLPSAGSAGPISVAGVMDAPAAQRADWRDEAVLVVVENGLAAIGTERPDVPLVEDAQAAELGAWEELLRAHERVLERAAEAGTVLPFRFGITFHDAAGIRGFLAERAGRVRDALRALDGKREWGVKCRVERASLVAAPAQAEAAAPAGGGAAYLARKQAELRARESAEDVARQVARDVHEVARAHAVASVVGDPPPDDRGWRGLLAASYLVARTREGAFHEALQRVADEHAGRGLSVELTGPWPPYHFVPEGLAAR